MSIDNTATLQTTITLWWKNDILPGYDQEAIIDLVVEGTTLKIYITHPGSVRDDLQASTAKHMESKGWIVYSLLPVSKTIEYWKKIEMKEAIERGFIINGDAQDPQFAQGLRKKVYQYLREIVGVDCLRMRRASNPKRDMPEYRNKWPI